MTKIDTNVNIFFKISLRNDRIAKGISVNKASYAKIF